MLTTTDSATLVPSISKSPAAASVISAMVVSLAETVGLVSPAERGDVSRDQVRAAFDAFAAEGIGSSASAAVNDAFTAETVTDAGSRLLEALEHNPMPHREWMPMSSILGDELLAELVGVAEVSLRRYRTGQRSTPDEVAVRLHQITLLATFLAGSYNAFGIRRWFTRPRTALHGRAPKQVLARDWDPANPDVQAVTSLAATLLRPVAA